MSEKESLASDDDFRSPLVPDEVSVKFFNSSSRGTNMHFKNDKLFTISPKDLDKKVTPPTVTERGRRTFYCFESEPDTV